MIPLTSEIIVINKGRLYYPISLDIQGITEKKQKYENSIILNGFEVPLFPGPTLDELVQAQEFIEPLVYNNLKAKTITKIFNELEITKNLDFLDKWQEKYELIYRIIFKIMPGFLSLTRNTKINKALNGATKALTEEELMDKLLEVTDTRDYIKTAQNVEEIKQIKDIQRRIKAIDAKTTSAWNYILENSKQQETIQRENKKQELVRKLYGLKKKHNKDQIYVIKFGEVYKLDSINFTPTEIKNKTVIKINNNLNLIGNRINNRTHINKIINKSLEDLILVREKDNILNNIEKIKNEIKKNITKKISLLLYFANKTEFELDNFGFIKNHEESYTIYVRAPKFAMKNPNREEYYRFDSCRIGLDFNMMNMGSNLKVLDAYTHPFLQGYNKANQKICMLSDVNLGGLTQDQKIIKRLSDGLIAILHGLTKKSLRRHGGQDIHDSKYWSAVLSTQLNDKKITRKEAVRQGYMITNFLRDV